MNAIMVNCKYCRKKIPIKELAAHIINCLKKPPKPRVVNDGDEYMSHEE